MSESARPLGRRPPTDEKHLARFSLTPETVPDKPTPVVLGIWWFSAFDVPEQDSQGRWWIGRGNDWGPVRGGHAICAKPSALKDTSGWASFYDQGQEGACVGFAASRMMSLLNRRRFDAQWLFEEARKNDEWPGEDYDGTSVRAGMDILRNVGHRRKFGPFSLPADIRNGIERNLWATDVIQVLACLHDDGASNSIQLLNSWGRSYPHIVHLPLESLDRLLRDEGEATVCFDR